MLTQTVYVRRIPRSAFLLGLALVCCSRLEAGAPSFTIPVPDVEKLISKTQIFPGEPFMVTIKVTGAQQLQDERVPTSVVFVLDESGSMATDDKFLTSRAAVVAVAELLVEGIDQAALVTFSDSATVVEALTTTISDVIAAVGALPSPGGLTNMAGAFDAALTQLATAATPNKIVILFTDGVPEPDPVAQINEMVGPLTAEAIDLGVQVFPVTLDAEQFWLEDIAEETFGGYTDTIDISELQGIFEAAFEEVSNLLTTKNVAITEVLAPDLMYIPMTLDFSFSGAGETPDFANAVAESELAFVMTNSLALPPIPFLPAGRNFTFSFEATSVDCLTPLSPVEEVDLDVDDNVLSEVAYTVGDDDIYTVGIPPRLITCKRPADIIVHKWFDEVNLVVLMELRNGYQDRSLTDLELFEALTFGFEPLLETADPPIDGAPVTVSTTPHRQWLYWTLDELGPGESAQFSFGVRVLACAPEESPPLDVNLLIPGALESIACFRPHVNYRVAPGLDPAGTSVDRVVSHLEVLGFTLGTSIGFDLPPCPTDPGSLDGTVGTGMRQCPEEVLDSGFMIHPRPEFVPLCGLFGLPMLMMSIAGMEVLRRRRCYFQHEGVTVDCSFRSTNTTRYK